VDLAWRHRDAASDVEPRVLEVLRTGRYVGGPFVDEVERTAATWFGRAGAVGVNSGTDALTLALQAVGVRPGDEVIVPALPFFATAVAVRALGAEPVVVDVGADGCLDPEAACAAVTGRTRTVVPVHLFGTLARAPECGVPVVDDAAQAVGGTPPRSLGTLTAVSAYPTKTWGGAGDGGFVLGDDPDALERVRLLANHGHTEDGFTEPAGQPARNSRLDALQAAVLLGHAPHLAARVARRRALAARYDAALPPGVSALPRDPGSPVHHYVALVPDRDRVAAALCARGVESRVYYPRPLHEEPALARAAHTPVADDLCRRVLALPVHAGLSDEDADVVLEALHAAVRR